MTSKNGTKAMSSTPQPPETLREEFIRENKIDVNFLKLKASAGSSVAAGVLAALDSCLRLLNFWEGKDRIFESESMYLLNLTYDCLAHDYQIFPLPEEIMKSLKQILDPLYEKTSWTKGEMEMKARFCYARFSCDNDGRPASEYEMNMPPIGIELLKKGIEMYPENLHYYNLLVTALSCLEDYKSASVYTTKGLKKFPDNGHLLYFKACVLRTKLAANEVTRADSIAAFQDYLVKVPEDHPSVPKAYYHLALFYSNEVFTPSGKNMMERYYKLGLEAEKKMLFLHFVDGRLFVKQAVETFLGFTDRIKEKFERIINQPHVPGRSIVLINKPYLDNPTRMRLIINYRRQLMNETKQPTSDSAKLPKCKPKLKQTYPNTWPLKSITLKEMNMKTDTVLEGCSINLTIIEEPIVKSGLMQVIAQDKDGDVTRVFIYNYDGGSKSKEPVDKVGFACIISFLHPYVQVGHDEAGIALRNDEPKCLMHLVEIHNMCRFCGRGNAPLKCSQCKKAWYCSKECQQHDWKLLKHKLICSKAKM